MCDALRKLLSYHISRDEKLSRTSNGLRIVYIYLGQVVGWLGDLMLQFISTAYQVKVWRDLSLQQHVARERFLWQLNLFGRHEKLTPWQGHAG